MSRFLNRRVHRKIANFFLYKKVLYSSFYLSNTYILLFFDPFSPRFPTFITIWAMMRKTHVKKRKRLNNIKKSANQAFSKKNPKKAITFTRERLKLNVISPQQNSEPSKVPECKHGPCLLFSNEDGTNQWFACSVFRSKKRCPFSVTIHQNGALQSYKLEEIVESLPFEEYGRIRKRYQKLVKSGKKIFWWCKCCSNYFGNEKHEHKLKGPYNEWKKPFELIDPLQDDAGEAQYFFSSETLDLLSNVIEAEQFDSILCIGVPTLFEQLRGSNIKTFLLDFDDRLAKFYNPDEFARFSMLVCHFFLSVSRNYLLDFFRGSKKLLCLCDPPFGIHVSALMRTLSSLREVFCSVSTQKQISTFNVIIFLPYFVGKHLREHSMTMVDFKVTYSNHRDFSRPQKSVVRMFTDITNSSFVLPTGNYHFCEQCDRFVAEQNKHCWKCGECTSKDGTTYFHCDRCARCVRQTYKHCTKCSSCHLKNRCFKS